VIKIVIKLCQQGTKNINNTLTRVLSKLKIEIISSEQGKRGKLCARIYVSNQRKVKEGSSKFECIEKKKQTLKRLTDHR